MHLGVAIPPTASPPRVDLKQTPLRLACIATLTAVKGHRYLLSALRRVKDAGSDVSCVLFGSGPLRDEIARMIDDLDLGERVQMTPQVRAQELLSRLQEGQFDGVVLTSVDEGFARCEGIPVSLMEAMAAGIPGIVTRSGSVPELVDETNGLLAEPKDVEAIAAAICTFASDAALRRRLGENARSTVEKAFCVEKTAHDFANLIGAENTEPLFAGRR